MTAVLLFVEHELNEREAGDVLHALADLREDGEPPVDVTVLVPCPRPWPGTLALDVAAARGLPASRAVGEMRTEAGAAQAAARRTLRHCVAAVRGGGHPARGELVPVGDAVRDLTSEAAARHATAAVLVSSPHRVRRLLHRDFEHRLRHAGLTRVVSLDRPVSHGPVRREP